MRPTRGKPASVEFDAAWALAREESKGDVVGFYHTHPGGSPSPSRRDLKTMRAWSGSFGKPLLCLIESDGQLRAYRFDNDESDGVEITACELLPRGIVVAFDDCGEASDGK
jgi:proteasome lid subunit RPN8/RPN11